MFQLVNGKAGENYGNQQERGPSGKGYSNCPGDNSYPLGLYIERVLEARLYCRRCLIAADCFRWVLTLKIGLAEGLQQKIVGEGRGP